MPSLFVLPKQVPLTSAGSLMAGAKLLFSATGSSTPQNTYSDILLTTPNANPVIADGNGVFSAIFLDPSLPSYRVILKTSADVVLYTQDDVPSNQNTAQTFRLKAAAPALIFEETDASANNKRWRLNVNGEQLTLDTGNDAESVWTNVLKLTRTNILSLNDAGGAGSFPLITGTTGTFTATLTGMTGSTTGIMTYERVSSIVTLEPLSPPIVGTSGSTAMTLTGLPAAICPQSTLSVSGVCFVRDNGADFKAAAYVISAAGVITFMPLSGTTYSATGFTAANSKGLTTGWSLMYSLNKQPF